MAVAQIGNRYFFAGGNNGQGNPRIYVLDEAFNLRGSFRQPGNSNGLGFLDLATDGRQTLYGSYGRFVVEFNVDGELGDELNAPRGISTVRGLGVDHTYAQDFRDFYLGGDEGFISVTDGELWQRDSIFVGDTVRAIAIKGNSRHLYLMTEPRPGVAILNLVDPDRKVVIPLYPIFAPRGERIGGIEIFHDPSDSKGVLIGIWKGEDDAPDRIFALDIYTTWIVSLPKPFILFPNDTAVWNVTIAGNQVEPGIYEDNIFLTVNGWGESGEVRLILWAAHNVKSESSEIAPNKPVLISCYPQPFNSQTFIQIFLPSPLQFRWRVVDITGRTRLFGQPVLGGRGLNTLNLNLTTLPSGIYFLNVEFTIDGAYPTLKSPLVLVK
ncbi:MAG: T9SS type A sorting domain-containing protein, partial [bacterium]